MKNLVLIFLILLSSDILSQFQDYPQPDEGVISGGLGVNWIDGKPYYRIAFRPEVSFSQVGFGLDLNFDIGSDGKIRTENFNESSDYLSIIRYVRYGYKNDPVYVKVGALDYYSLGHGSIMLNYNNSPTYDNRRIGLVLDIDLGKFGIESIYSSFSPSGVLALRGYIRPLQLFEVTDLPIISNLEVGASYAADINKDAGVIDGNYDPVNQEFIVTDDLGAINIYGFDIGLPFIKSSTSELTVYLDYAKIVNFGSGIATGVKFDFDLSSVIRITSRFERRFNQSRYVPAYFNSLHEINRLQIDSTTNTFTSKAKSLSDFTDATKGWYGDLLIRVFDLFDIYGSYQRIDELPKSGILNLRAAIEPEEAPFVLRAGYDKINIQNEKDVFTLDDRSYLFAETGYKPYPFLLLSLYYSWTFTPVRGSDDRIISFEPQRRIEPRISFIQKFDF